MEAECDCDICKKERGKNPIYFLNRIKNRIIMSMWYSTIDSNIIEISLPYSYHCEHCQLLIEDFSKNREQDWIIKFNKEYYYIDLNWFNEYGHKKTYKSNDFEKKIFKFLISLTNEKDSFDCKEFFLDNRLNDILK